MCLSGLWCKAKEMLFDIVSEKLYLSLHVIFFEHILFFSTPTISHKMTKFDLIRIDPFTVETEMSHLLFHTRLLPFQIMILAEFRLIVL